MGRRLLTQFLVLIIASLLTWQPAMAHKAKKSATLSIVTPSDNAKVPRSFSLRFEAKKVDISAVGKRKHKSGHVILLVDTDLPDPDEPVPMDPNHIHFVKGESAARITLSPGKRRLQILLGDEEHVLFQDWLISDPITVWVED